jgi:L-lactate dehydrogenase complex protein LldG
MNSREKILAAVKNNQPAKLQLPDINQLKPVQYESNVDQFCKVLESIGGNVVKINTLGDISSYVAEHYQTGHNLLTTIDGVSGLKMVDAGIDPHELETVEFAVLSAVFGVAENGAVWLSENEMQVRVLPFIVQHLAMVLPADKLLPHMHAAYELIGNSNYGFGVFIAGPSKTADIEQSLVLGAHGPRSMTVFLLSSLDI